MKRKMNLINIGYNPWSPFWKRNQTMVHLMSGWDVFDRTLFINPETWMAELFKNPFRQFSGLKRFQWKRVRPKQVDEKTTVFTPCHWPLRSRHGYLAAWNDASIWASIENYVKTPFTLLLNNPRFWDQALVTRLMEKASLKIFDWSDDFAEFSLDAQERAAVEDTCSRYCALSDVVLTVNRSLAERAGAHNGNAHVLRNATNFFTFDEKFSFSRPPDWLDSLKGPVIGYVGWLNGDRLDAELVEFVATRRPRWNFVFMGPKSGPNPLGKRVPRLRNVRIVPPVPYPLLPACLKRFNICILPNKINAHTRGNDPLKLYDYLGAGKPVVSTRTAGVEDFQNNIWIAEHKQDFLIYLDWALLDDSPERHAHRQKLARDHSWQKRMEELEILLQPWFRRRSYKPHAVANGPARSYANA
jgi:glycosyltransferase involved in cell wall biosynthesis